MRFHKRLYLIFLPALILSSSSLLFSAPIEGYDPHRDYKTLPLERLIEQPKSYKNTDIHFRAYFHKIDNLWSPFFSPFNADDHVSFSVWKPQTRLWVKNERVNDFPFLYIENRNEDLDPLLRANKYALIEIRGTVKSAFNGYPWIEVRHLDVVNKKPFNKETLRTLILGREAEQKNSPSKATRYYKKAVQYHGLPNLARAQIYRSLALNYFRSFEYERAMEAVEGYREYAVESKRSDDTLDRIYKKSKELLEMPPERRHEYERNKLKSKKSTSDDSDNAKKSETSFQRNNGSLQGKYKTLLTKYEKLVKKNQSLKSNNSQLTKKLASALQSKAKLQAKLHKLRKNKKPKNKLATSSEESPESPDTTLKKRKQNEEDHQLDPSTRKRLIRRIRTLKQRNQSLRSRISALNQRLSRWKRNGQKENAKKKPAIKSNRTADGSPDAASNSPGNDG